MKKAIYSVITGTGCYIPEICVKNEYFLNNTFYDAKGQILDKDNNEIIEKFQEITTISERQYASDKYVTSDIAYFAAEEAIKSAQIDRETLDYVIVAHNFGDIKAGSNRTEIMPTIGSRVKHKLGIKNPFCVAYDVPFGCPGWVQAMIQANYYIKSGDAKKILVIGAEILSRLCDPHDRDSMIYADGAGAAILETKESEQPIGILGHITRSDTIIHSRMLFMGGSYNPNYDKPEDLYLKMHGRKLYQYALENVPQAIKSCLDRSNVDLKDVSKILIHQANGKMDEAILKRLYKLYNIQNPPEFVMPMIIEQLGNSSVATIPTLLDFILKGNKKDHQILPGDNIVFASVGAGMNINAICYKMI